MTTPYRSLMSFFFADHADNREHVLIPVLYRKCEIPAAIAPLYYCDYPRFKDDPDIDDFFWNKLCQALSHDPA